VSAFRAFGLVKGDWKPISRAFTDAMSEFAAVSPNRLAVSYQVPIIDIDYAVAEVQRLGPTWRLLDLWNDLYLIGLFLLGADIDPAKTGFDQPPCAIFTSLPALALAEVIAWWILTGTLERFPGLQIVFVEPGLYWIPGFLAGLDRKADGRYELPGLRLKPSEYFRRNMACTFMDDMVGLQARHLIGIENILWSTDFPHPATTWPNSVATVEAQFEGIPVAEREAITCGNAARIYKL
jgi:predicted TIM-barrel fold metal-dependent hydrolase